MSERYRAWIDALSGSLMGRCKDVSAEMAKAFPELKQVRGHYLCPIWGDREHWWCVTPAKEIIDPTARQFPSGGLGEYIEWAEGAEEPTGKCPNCGGYVFRGKTFCDDSCYREAVAALQPFAL